MTHYFIRLLDKKGLLLRHYTQVHCRVHIDCFLNLPKMFLIYLILSVQNIDTLERVAGIPGKKLVEAHGTFYSGHCLRCHKSYTQDWIKCMK